jgi:hypothetical protein
MKVQGFSHIPVPLAISFLETLRLVYFTDVALD